MSVPVNPLLASKLCTAFGDVKRLEINHAPEVCHVVLLKFKQRYEAFAEACVAAGIEIKTLKEFECEIATYNKMMIAIASGIIIL